MLEKVLEIDRYPYATIAVNDHPAGGRTQPLRVAIALHGTMRSIEAPVQFRSAGEEVTATGSLAYALIYPIAVPAVCLVLSLFLMPETRQMSVWDEDENPRGREAA